MLMKARTLILPALLISAILVTGCKKDDSNENANAREFKVRMTDAPGDYTALNVKILSVDAYHQDGNWINLSNETQAADILDLTNGQEKIIAKKIVKSGVYSKLRITFAQEASVKVTEATGLVGNTTIHSVYDLTWAGSTEITLDIAENVGMLKGANVLVDFNVAASVKLVDGVYYLDPVITVAGDESTGIKGDVDGSAHAVVMLIHDEDTISTYTDISGHFLMRGVQEGTYELVVIPETEGTPDHGIEYRATGLVIRKGTIKNLGTINL
jgi:hypothetical protein